MRLNTVTQNAVFQSFLSGSLGSMESPVGTNGTLMATSSGTPQLWMRACRNVFFRPWNFSPNTSLSETPFSFWLADAKTMSANVNTITAWFQIWKPKAVDSFFIVSKSSLRNLVPFISVQNRIRSNSIFFSLIFFIYSLSLPFVSASPGVSNTVIFTLFFENS